MRFEDLQRRQDAEKALLELDLYRDPPEVAALRRQAMEMSHYVQRESWRESSCRRSLG